jgi:hypothetical protein
VPEDRLALGTSAPVPDLRSCRVLRRLAEPARDGALPRDRAPGHRGLRPARWGWCHIDEVMLNLSDRATPHNVITDQYRATTEPIAAHPDRGRLSSVREPGRQRCAEGEADMPPKICCGGAIRSYE